MFARLPTELRDALAGRSTRVVDDPSLVPAAVLVLVCPRDGEPQILFTRRTEEVEHHKGEISFPGGAQDPEDSGWRDTALRETEEEMGIGRENVTVLGRLDDTPTRTGFVIRPFVGVIGEDCSYRPSPAEIAEVIEIPLSALMCSGNRRSETRWSDGVPRRTRSFVHDGHLIWGATASIVEMLVSTLEPLDWRFDR
jgi:8-oxo-dGTP pyrophosphatase MutT (NUDIX family)